MNHPSGSLNTGYYSLLPSRQLPLEGFPQQVSHCLHFPLPSPSCCSPVTSTGGHRAATSVAEKSELTARRTEPRLTGWLGLQRQALKASDWRRFAFPLIFLEARKAAVWKTMTHILLLYYFVFLLPTESCRTLCQVSKGRWEEERVGKQMEMKTHRSGGLCAQAEAGGSGPTRRHCNDRYPKPILANSLKLFSFDFFWVPQRQWGSNDLWFINSFYFHILWRWKFSLLITRGVLLL